MLEKQFNDVCKVLGIADSDESAISILQITFEYIESAVCLRIGESSVPKALEWLVSEVVIKRYQLIGAEHLLSESIDVIASTFKRGDILDDYEDYLQSYIDNIQAKSESGKIASKRKLRML